MDINNHLRSGNYLPKPLKDFHAQKDVFKCVDEMAQRYAEAHRTTVPNRVDAMCYVIDVFLWFMAMHGYTLQKTRQKVEGVKNLEDTIATVKEKEREIFWKIVDARNDKRSEV